MFKAKAFIVIALLAVTAYAGMQAYTSATTVMHSVIAKRAAI